MNLCIYIYYICVCDCGVWLCVWAVCHSLLITMGGHLTCWSTRETHKISKSHLWLPLGDAKLAIYWYEVSATKPQLVANIYPPESKKSNWSSRPSLAGPVLVQKIKNIAFMLARFLLVPGDFLPGSDQGCHNCHRKPMPLTVSVPNSTMGQWVLSAPKPVESRWSVSKPVESRWTWQITRPQSESSYSERAWTCKYKKKSSWWLRQRFQKNNISWGPLEIASPAPLKACMGRHGSLCSESTKGILVLHGDSSSRQDCCMSSVILRMT